MAHARRPDPAPGPTRRTALLLVGLASLPLLVLGLHEAHDDSPTYDEGIYVAAGTTALTRHDLRLNQEHPPLAKIAAAAPVLLARPVVPGGRNWRNASEHDYADEFLRAQADAGKLRLVMFLGRLVPLGEAVITGFAVYALATGLFGRVAGLFAGCLWQAGPFLLGLGHLDGIDLPFTVVTLALCIALRRHLEHPRRSTLVTLGVVTGTALLVRHSGLLMLPVAALGAGGPRWRASRAAALRAAALVVVLAWAMVWAGYRAVAPVPSPASCSRSGVVRLVVAAVPVEYACGVARLANVSKTPARAFLLGRAWTGSRWWFWPGSMVVKLPPTMLVALIVGPFMLARAPAEARRPALATVVLPGAVLGLFTMFQPRPLGLRYFLPVLALWVVAASPLVGALGRVAGRAVGVALVAGSQVALVTSYPHSIAWAAPGLRPGYRVATDSNLDWGQDLYRLQEWSRGKRPWVAYFGPSSLLDVGPPVRHLEGADIRRVRGWAAVSATLLTGDGKDRLSWLRAYCPVRTLGGSILVYRFDGPPQAGTASVVPARPCRGRTSVRSSAA